MKESFWGYFIIILGIFVITIMIITQNLTTTSEEDYYLTKEVMEAAMIDSVDYGLYRQTGEIRIIQSKFVENFTRRFADSVNGNKEYKLDFYEIYETPPKATVKISTTTGEYKVNSDTVNFDILTTLSGILETKYGYTTITNNDNEEEYKVNLTLISSETKWLDGYTEKSVTTNNGEATFSLNEIQHGTNKYEFDNVTCDGGSVSSTFNKITIKNVTSDIKCNVTLKNK